jgi:enamine deaminase RidA (YjgF/YER057c/UK114 family)
MIRILAMFLLVSAAVAEPKIERHSRIESRVFPEAVVVDSAALVHTGQILPYDKDGKLGDVAAQVNQVFDNLKAVLHECGSSGAWIVRLNIHVKDAAVSDSAIIAVMRDGILGDPRLKQLPVISELKQNLPHPDVVIAVDAVAVGRDVKSVELVRFDKVKPYGGAAAAILPAGPRAYVAGQAEKGATPAEATRKTLESLRNTLKFMGLNDSHVVQSKCFLTPMKSRDEVVKEFEEFFGKDKVPPLVFVEWKSNLPIEIELIAHAPAPKRKAWDEIDYLTPPGMTASPVYSRVARVHADKTIYIGTMTSELKGDGKTQVEGTFAQLKKLLDLTDSDFRHLVKATYFVSDEDCSKQLNELRPNYYDKYRPPSASKAMVANVGNSQRGLAIDMIAVPSSIKKEEGKPRPGFDLRSIIGKTMPLKLFDGETTFGWDGSKVVDGAIVGGRTTTEWASGELFIHAVKGGKFKLGTREYAIADKSTLIVNTIFGKGPLVLGDGVAISTADLKFDGLKSIIPGPNLEGWKRIDRATIPEEKRPKWGMKDGILEAVGGPGALEYPTLYGNVVIQVEARSRNRHANGGVFFRSIPGDFMNGYEAQIHSACEKGDPSKPAEYATGGIDDRQNARRLVSRDFEPFVMTILADGPHIATWVNGYQVTDWTDARKEAKNPRQGLRLEAGTIQLQAHDPATDLEIRAIRVAALK